MILLIFRRDIYLKTFNFKCIIIKLFIKILNVKTHVIFPGFGLIGIIERDIAIMLNDIL